MRGNLVIIIIILSILCLIYDNTNRFAAEFDPSDPAMQELGKTEYELLFAVHEENIAGNNYNNNNNNNNNSLQRIYLLTMISDI
jgi:hypothetical protein